MTSSGGTSSARITKKVEAGGSSTYLSRMAPNWSMRWKSSSTSTLRLPSAGERAACLTTCRAVGASMRPWAVVASTTWRSGCVSASARRRWRSASSPSEPADSRSAGEGPRRGALARAAGPDEQVGVDGVDGRGGELGDGVVLADDVRPHVDPGHRGHGRIIAQPARAGSGEIGEADGRRSPRWPRRRRPRVPVPSTIAHRSGSAIACTRNPSWTRAWKASPGRLDAVLGPGQPELGVPRRHLEQDDEVGPQPVGGPARQLLDLGRR